MAFNNSTTASECRQIDPPVNPPPQSICTCELLMRKYRSILTSGAEQNLAQGSRGGFWGPLGLGIRPPISATRDLGKLGPRKGSQRPRRGSSGASDRRARSQRSGENKVGRFPGCPLKPSGSNPRAPTLGPQSLVFDQFLSQAPISKQGSTPTLWARGLRDQIQKWALQTQKPLYF